MKRLKSNKINNHQSIILYELNEIPPKIINFFIEKFPKSNLSKLINSSAYFKTTVNDSRHLHPWSVWPSVHRGVSIEKHKLNFINQDKSASNKYPPIWEIVLNSGKEIGVHGSLQSYPPCIHKNSKFFLPDTFAPDSKAFPKELSYLQEFNLYLIGVSQGTKKLSIRKLMRLFLRIFLAKEIKLETIFILCLHYFKEKLFKKYISRRSIYQSTLTFDSYIKNLKNHKPIFSSYFTNHLAGMMHRYWKDLFPESFGISHKSSSEFNKISIIKALKETDKHIGILLQYAKNNNSDLLIISGMGQDARIRDQYIGELQFIDFNKFKSILFTEHIDNFDILPAMLPDICISFKNKKIMRIFIENINKITDGDFTPIFEIPYEPELTTLNLSLKLSKRLTLEEEVLILDKKFKLDEIGLRIIKRDPGTAYHIQEGTLIWFTKRNDELKQLANQKYIPDIIEIAPSICKLLNIKIPKYMIKHSPLINSI